MSIAFRSVNPKNNKLYRTFDTISNKVLETHLENSYQRFRQEYTRGHSRLGRRFEKLSHLSQIMSANRATYAGLITQEMGKPITQAEGEIDKCISHLQYYIDNTERFMEDEQLQIAN